MNIFAVEQFISNISVFLSVFCLVLAIIQSASSEQKLVMSYALFSLLTCIGYFGILYSNSVLGVMVWATKCKYVGSISLSLLLLLMLRYMHISVPKWVVSVVSAVIVFLLLLVLGFDAPARFTPSNPQSIFAFMHTWLFKQYAPDQMYGIPFLHTVSNWGQYVYVALIVFYIIAYSVIFIHSMRTNLTLDRINFSLLYLIMMIPGVCFVAEEAIIELSGVQSIPLVPVGFDISNLLFIYLIFGRHFCNVNMLANPAVFDAISVPSFVLDKKYRIVNINKKAFAVFSQITEQDIGCHLFDVVEQMNVPIIDAMLNAGTQVDSENEFIMVENNAFHPRIQVLGHPKNPDGYVIWLEDVTLLNNYKQNLEAEVEKKTEELKFTADKMRAMRDQMVMGFSAIAERHDLSSKGHLRRTANYTEAIAFELLIEKKFPDQIDFAFVERMGQIAPLHDIGKIYIDNAILNKTGGLTPEERLIMEKHTIYGEEFIERTMKENVDPPYVQMAKDISLSHHEWWDGSGYPNHLCANAIPLSARIMAVADVFDALVTVRPYKKAFSTSEAYAIIRKESGTHFDPVVVEAFEAIRSQIEEIKNYVGDSAVC